MQNYPAEILTSSAIRKFISNFSEKKVAIIDLDGTTADSLKHFCLLLNQKFHDAGYEINFQPEDNVDFDIQKSLRKLYSDKQKYPEEIFSAEFVYEPFDRPEVFVEAEIIPETKYLIEKLFENNYKIIYATSRPRILIDVTQQWLSKYNLPTDMLLFENRSSNISSNDRILFKKDLISQILKVVSKESLFYDDKPQTLYETEEVIKNATAQNLKMFGRPTTWNKLPGSIDPISEKIQHLLKKPEEVLGEILRYKL